MSEAKPSPNESKDSGNLPPTQLNLRFFGALREVVGIAELKIQYPTDDANIPASTILLSDLHHLLAQCLDDDALAAITAENVRIAVDQQFIDNTAPISVAAEIAFLPPVTGG